MKSCAALFFSKGDPQDTRLGDLAVEGLPQKGDLGNSLLLLGCPGDEGILANGGRPGAAAAPDRIRHYFYRLTPHPQKLPFKIFDTGNLDFENSKDLESQHILAKQGAAKLYAAQKQSSAKTQLLPIFLGGGHDFGYSTLEPAFVGLEHFEDTILVNLDAHLDVRPFSGVSHSGTPFYQLLTQYPALGSRFLEWGIQPSSCSSDHYTWVTTQGAQVIFAGDMDFDIKNWILSKKKESSRKKLKCYLNIDMDVFSVALAPGCSAPAALGETWERVRELLKKLMLEADIVALGLFETSPKWDLDDRTSRLAAQIIHWVATEQLCQK